MITAVKADYVGLASCRTGNLHGVFQGFGTGVGQHHLGMAAYRYHAAEFFSQLHIALIGHDRLAGMHQLVQLRLDRFHHLRVAMANVQYTNAAGKIDHAFAVCIPQFRIRCMVGKLFIGSCRARRSVAFFECLQFFIAHFAILPGFRFESFI